MFARTRRPCQRIGDHSAALHSSDGGQTWLDLPLPDIAGLYGIWGAGAGHIYAVGLKGTVITHDGGAHWSVSQGTSGRAVWGSSQDDVYVVGNAGAILHTTDGGASWVSEPSPTQQNLDGVWGSGPGDVYAVGYGGAILHRTR